MWVTRKCQQSVHHACHPQIVCSCVLLGLRRWEGPQQVGGNVDQRSARGSAMPLANQGLTGVPKTFTPSGFQTSGPNSAIPSGHTPVPVPHPRFPSVKSDSCVVEQLLSQCVVGHPNAASGFGSEVHIGPRRRTNIRQL